MASPDDIENRLSAVERDVAELRQQTGMASVDASAARTLAAGADHDVSEVRAELRAHLSVLHALRDTQLDHGRRIDSLDRRLGGRIDSLDSRMTMGFDAVQTRTTQILTLLQGLADDT